MPQARDEAGNIWEVDAQGNPVRLIQQAQQPIGGQSPQYQVQSRTIDPQVQEATANAQNAGVDAAVNAATRDAQIRQARAQAEQAEAEARIAAANAARGPQPTAEQANRAATEEGLARRADTVRSLMGNILELYQQDIKGQPATRLFGASEYIDGLPRNERFTTAGRNILPLIRPLVAQTAREGDSDREMAIFESYIPIADDSDLTIENKLRALETLITGMTEGSPPSQTMQGNRRTETPLVDSFLNPGGGNGGNSPGPSAMDGTFVTTPDTPMAPSGQTGRTSTPIPPAMQQEYQAWVLQNAATMTPEAYTAFRQELDRKYGFESGDYAPEAQRIIDGVKNGGTLNLTIPPVDQPMTGLQSIRDMATNNPVTASLAGVANMGSFGGVEAIAPLQYGSLRDANPNSTMAGEIAGVLGPTAAIGRIGSAVTGAVAPRLLGGGAMASIGRGMATDAAYGGIYGGVTGQGVGESAAAGAIGSAVGQVGGRTLAGIGRGVVTSAPVQALTSRGIPLTTGQTVGGALQSVEDAMTSWPGVGDMINRRRREGLEAFNVAALRDAGAPINFVPQRAGREGVTDLMGNRDTGVSGAINDAYNNAVAGQVFTLDPQLQADVDGAMAGLNRLPPDLRQEADLAFRNTFEPLTTNNSISGQQYQGMRRDLSGYRAAQTGPGFPANYRDIMTGGIDALDNLATRQGGPQVAEGLAQANTANRLGNIVQDAAFRADGADYLFTPSQLQDAIKTSRRRFPGLNPLSELADNGQAVLPSSIPDSGTARRTAQMAIPGLLAASGGSAGYMAGGPEGAGYGGAGGLTLAALLALGGRRGSQQAINRALTERNPTVREFSDRLLRRSGLFGSAMVPVALASQR
ncbi:hypothetical protein [Alteraurantiacibacter buctensis]|uniref:Uncharacterized protein n=1 Tax=Alteraurantiacibacter buctensis TaxID=1503981 RepID=A0A844Z2X4_9SPHN|nr:hypothetical protein [Alteraurantiacibacter buctensis]MXO72867.1 hypothetical protein [Alteraurantiacibacter buctensis]